MAMNEQELNERWQAAATPADLQKLAAAVEAVALDAPAAVVHQWVAGAKDESEKAASVVLDLEELTVTPMLKEFDSASLNWRFHFMESAVESLLGLRRSIFQELDGLLGREAAVEEDGVASTGQPGAAGKRICDEAYLCVRRLAKVEAAKKDGFSSEGEFLKLGPADRSREILKGRRMRTG